MVSLAITRSAGQVPFMRFVNNFDQAFLANLLHRNPKILLSRSSIAGNNLCDKKCRRLCPHSHSSRGWPDQRSTRMPSRPTQGQSHLYRSRNSKPKLRQQRHGACCNHRITTGVAQPVGFLIQQLVERVLNRTAHHRIQVRVNLGSINFNHAIQVFSIPVDVNSLFTICPFSVQMVSVFTLSHRSD